MATTTTTRARASKPADVCRLSLTIRGEMYAVRVLAPEPGSGARRLLRLRKPDGSHYHVATLADGSPSCDCADATFRDRPGKHWRSGRAVGLL